MDWGSFFEATRKAANVESFAKLAPLLHVTDGAISHYRTGRSVPSAWTVALCLRIQGHAEPEREAARLMQLVAHSQVERAFWKKVSSAAAVVVLAAVLPFGTTTARAAVLASETMHYAHCALRRLRLFLGSVFTESAPFARLNRSWSRHATAMLA